MTLTAIPNTERNHVAQDTQSSLMRDARVLLDAVGLARSGNWISRVVRDFMSAPLQGLPFGMFLTAQVELNEGQRRRLAERADLRYLLTYADPTGEAAIRNVERDRR